MTNRHDLLIDTLSDDLAPVDRPWSPRKSLLLWLGLTVVLGLAVTPFADLLAVRERFAHGNGILAAAAGAAATALLGALATFQLSRPQASRWFSLLPVPALLLWIGASGLGCLKTATTLTTGASAHAISPAESEHCLAFIVGMSVPIGIVLFWMLRRATPAWPRHLAITAGLTIAATSATLLVLIHPFDATALDLAVHVFGIGLVIGVARLWSARKFHPAM